MEPVTENQLEVFVAACRKVAGYGLLRCSSGNLSWRLDADRMLVSASRSWLAEMTAEKVAVCRIADGTVLNEKTPSVETRFHRGILLGRPDVNVVLHFQSPFATTLACHDTEVVDFFVIPEIPYYIGPIAIVPYIEPGTEALAEAVVPALKEQDLAILRHHGQVAVGTTFDDTLQKAVFFELACEIIVRGGPRVVPLPRGAVERLLRGAKAKA